MTPVSTLAVGRPHRDANQRAGGYEHREGELDARRGPLEPDACRAAGDPAAGQDQRDLVERLRVPLRVGICEAEDLAGGGSGTSVADGADHPLLDRHDDTTPCLGDVARPIRGDVVGHDDLDRASRAAIPGPGDIHGIQEPRQTGFLVVRGGH